jgi:hypothetical protein
VFERVRIKANIEGKCFIQKITQNYTTMCVGLLFYRCPPLFGVLVKVFWLKKWNPFKRGDFP